MANNSMKEIFLCLGMVMLLSCASPASAGWWPFSESPSSPPSGQEILQSMWEDAQALHHKQLELFADDEGQFPNASKYDESAISRIIVKGVLGQSLTSDEETLLTGDVKAHQRSLHARMLLGYVGCGILALLGVGLMIMLCLEQRNKAKKQEQQADEKPRQSSMVSVDIDGEDKAAEHEDAEQTPGTQALP